MGLASIAVNGKPFARPTKEGTTRVAENLVGQIVRLRPDIAVDVFVPAGPDEVVLPFNWPARVKISVFRSSLYRSGVGRSLWEQSILPRQIRKKGPYDVLLNLTNSAPVLMSPGTRQLLVLHDVGFLNAEWFSASFSRYLRFVVGLAALRQIPLVTVSETSATQIRSRWPRFRSIAVVPNGSEEPPAALAARDLGYPYVLFLGSRNPRKNLGGAIEGFSRFRTQVSDPVRLVIVGGGGSIFQRDALEPETGPNVEWLGYVDDDERWSLLKGARALLFPSFLEGFGLPVLEAMKVGTPAVVSDIPVFRELFGAAVEYVDARSPDDIGRGLLRVYENDERRRELVQRGGVLCSSFTWERAARQYLDLLDALLR